jgi:hypothetical protein
VGREVSKRDIKKAYNFPKNWPFFRDLVVDDVGNIYVGKPLGEVKDFKGIKYDLFNKEGYYIYTVNAGKLRPEIIKRGIIYSWIYDPDTGYRKVIRNKIKNWDQLKEYRPK